MPTDSAKSTPAPPERTATPEAVRERRQEEQRLEMEARRKAAEAAAEAEKLKKEQEEAARKAAEEAEAERKAAAEAEAKRQAEEAEAARKREEEEMQRLAAEEAKRQEMLVARQDRISKLPRALRRACMMGQDRPLHFSGDELGISAVFLPLYYTTSQDLHTGGAPGKTYVCSFQLVGILGLPELDLAHLDSPYCDWPRIPVSHKQRDSILRQIDIDRLAQEYRFPMEFTPGYDYGKIQESIKEARNQFLAMDGLYWVEESLLRAEMEKVELLKPLLDDVKPNCGKRRVALTDIDESDEDKPKKTFMDLILAQNGVNGVHVNGDAG
jgi:flagellar biosynthesis GTPase FlhF